MRIPITLAFITLICAACASDQPRFDRMSEEDLQAYNADKPRSEQIYCYERKQTGSRITRRYCDSVRDILSEPVRNAQRVMVSQPSN